VGRVSACPKRALIGKVQRSWALVLSHKSQDEGRAEEDVQEARPMSEAGGARKVCRNVSERIPRLTGGGHDRTSGRSNHVISMRIFTETGKGPEPPKDGA
jgi:hypothetical protein